MFQPERKFMEAAIDEALKSKRMGDYAIGAVIVRNNEIITGSGNRTRLDYVATAHADKLVIETASRSLHQRHLTDCIVYTTHEPCPMCAGAIVMSKIPYVVVGARLEDMQKFALENGNEQWVWRTISVPATYIFEKGDPPPILISDFMREECLKLFHS